GGGGGGGGCQSCVRPETPRGVAGPADLWNEVARMLECGLAVAGVAGPVGLLASAVARRHPEPILPRPLGWRVSWRGFEVFVAFVVVSLLVPAVIGPALAQSGLFVQVYGPDFPLSGQTPTEESSAAAAGATAASVAPDRLAEAATVRGLWTGLVSLPLQLGLLLWVRSVVYPAWKPPARRSGLAGSVALAVAAWAVLTPIVLVVHFSVNLTFASLGWTVEDHPLTHLSVNRPLLDQGLFVAQACIGAPLVEEVLFRGVLLPWLLGRKHRAWPVLTVGVVLAVALSADEEGESKLIRGPVLFAGVLFVGWMLLSTLLRRKRRTAVAI